MNETPSPVLEATPWRWYDPIAVFLLALLSTTLIMAVLARRLGTDVGLSVFVVVNAASMCAWTLAWARRRGVRPRALGLSSGDTRGDVLAGIATGIGSAALSVVVVVPLVTWLAQTVTGGPVSPPTQLDFRDPGPGVLALAGLGAVVLAPIGEELLFRGLAFRVLRRRAGVWLSAAVSAGVWAALHVHPLVIPTIFVFGIILAHVVERRRSLIPAIVAHVVFNIIGFVALLFSS